MVREDIVANEQGVMQNFDFNRDATDTVNYLMRIGEENMARRLRSASSRDWHEKMTENNLKVIYG